MQVDVKMLEKVVKAYAHMLKCPDIRPTPAAVGGEEGRSHTERWVRELG
jgi:hypothetical protein